MELYSGALEMFLRGYFINRTTTTTKTGIKHLPFVTHLITHPLFLTHLELLFLKALFVRMGRK
jgi:hypothetical protein